MRQRIVLALILLVCISISFGYVRRSMYELYTNTGCGPCTPANDYLDDNYYMYVDQVNLVRFHVSWPSSGDPFYVVNPSQPSDRRVYYSITGVPKAIVNGRSLSSWSGSITTAVAEAGTYTPLELEMSVMDSGLCHIEVICNDPSYDNTLSLVCVLNEDTLYYSAPNGQTEFFQTVRWMLPDWDGENIHISGDTVISRDFDFLSHMDIVGNLSNCWYTAWLQDFSSSGEVVQSNKISAFAIMPYNHQVQYGTTNAYVASDDTVSFDFSVKNYGLNDDNYDIWMESSFPGSWLVEIEGSGSSFDSSRIAIASGVEEDFSVNISPIGDIDNGSAMVYVRAVDDPEAVTDTIIFGAFSGGDILLISSIPANDDVIYYKDLLDDNDIQYVSWPKEDYGNPPDISDIDFDAIIWHDGINTSDPVSAEEKDAIRAYLENGGKMLISSSTFGQMSGMTYFMLVIGAMREGSESVPTGVTGLEPGTEFTGYTASLLGSYAEKIIPQSDARGVLRFTTGPFCALTKDFEGGGKLVYFSFKYEDIASETERDDLWDRIMEYWGDVSVQNLYTPNSHAIVDIYPNPFNGAVGISIDLPEENEVEIEIYDISGNLVDRISPGMLSASKSIVKWQPKGITSGIYLARVLFSGETIEKKLIYLK